MTQYGSPGQVNPAATTNTTLYTAGVQAVASSLIVCNQGVATTIRIAVRPAGATLAAKHYIAYDAPIRVGESLFYTVGLSAAATDVITVYAGTSTVSFTWTGVESP